MDFASLKTRLQRLIGRAPDELVYELVTADINQQLRLREMETEVTLTEAAVVDVPDDFLKALSVYRDTSPRTVLEVRPMQVLQRTFDASGMPRFYAIENDQMRLSPSPDGAENIVLRYVAKLDDLAADDSTNVVLTSYPSVYIYGALTHHGLIIRDSQVQAWATAYKQAMDQAKQATVAYRQGAGTPVPVPRATA